METELLQILSKQDIENSLFYARAKGYDHTELIGVLNSLSLEGYIITANFKLEELTLTEEGKNYLKDGSPEAQVFNHIKSSKLTQDQLSQLLPKTAKIGFAQAMKNK